MKYGCGYFPQAKTRSELAQNGYYVRVYTRDPESATSKRLASTANVTLAVGAVDDAVALKKAFDRVDYAFVNLNSWALGIKNELFWGIRIFEIAVNSGVKHYIWSSLDNYFHQTRYDDSLRAGHYYGKGHVEQWMMNAPQEPMNWSILTTSPYLEQLWGLMRPAKSEDGTYDFRFPVGKGGFPLTSVSDMGFYTRYILENPAESAGINLKIGVEHATPDRLAEAFTAATGKAAKGTSISIDDWFEEVGWTAFKDHKMGSSTAAENDPTLLTVYDSFSNWWRVYQQSPLDQTGLIRRDYAKLDEIHPNRVRDFAEWMRAVKYDPDKLDIITVTAPMSL